jgi:DNA-binding MarR family transcriptional regulator
LDNNTTLLLDLDGLAVASVERLEDGTRRVHMVTTDEGARACPAVRNAVPSGQGGSALTRPRDLPFGQRGLELVWGGVHTRGRRGVGLRAHYLLASLVSCNTSGMVNTKHRLPRTGPSQDEIEAFQQAARDLIGVALRSLEVADEGVSLPQMRLLLALHDQGRCPSSQVANVLGLGASSVTRLAERLVNSGHVLRGSDPRHRSVVTLGLTPLGRRVVDHALGRRQRELERILSRLSPELRATTVSGLQAFHQVVSEEYTADLRGPVPL